MAESHIHGPFVFVSYARPDQDYVTALVGHLDDVGVPVWIDANTHYGDTWPAVIRDRVDRCAALVVVVTPRSEQSEWVRREIIRAQQQAKAILPLLLEGSPFFELNTIQHDDVSDGCLPSAEFVGRLKHLISAAPPASPSDPAAAPGKGDAESRHWLDEANRLARLGNHRDALTAYERAGRARRRVRLCPHLQGLRAR